MKHMYSQQLTATLWMCLWWMGGLLRYLSYSIDLLTFTLPFVFSGFCFSGVIFLFAYFELQLLKIYCLSLLFSNINALNLIVIMFFLNIIPQLHYDITLHQWIGTLLWFCFFTCNAIQKTRKRKRKNQKFQFCYWLLIIKKKL